MPLKIVRGDITKIECDAIVCVEHLNMYSMFGYDTHIYMAAGYDQVRHDMEQYSNLKTGDVAITPGHNLPAGYIIHAVISDHGICDSETLLRRVCRRSLRLARQNGLHRVSLPVFRIMGGKSKTDEEMRITVDEIKEYLLRHPDMDVTLTVLTSESVSLAKKRYPELEIILNSGQFSHKYPDGHDDPEEQYKRLVTMVRTKITDSAGGYSCSSYANLRSRSYEGQRLDNALKNPEKSFMEMVFTYADERNMTDPELYALANIDRKAFNKLKNGTTRHPKKSTALALAVALKLDLEQTKELLSFAGLALSPCEPFDIVVGYMIDNGHHSVTDINEALFEHQIPDMLGNVET